MSNWTQTDLEILIVDDSLAVREWVTHSLEGSGRFRLTISDTAEEALALTRRNAFDVILLDLGMPRTDGSAVIRALTEVQPTASIVALVTDETREESLAALRAGASTYLTKPFTWDKVCHALDTVFGNAPHDEQFIMDGAICLEQKDVSVSADLVQG